MLQNYFKLQQMISKSITGEKGKPIECNFTCTAQILEFPLV